ncbi:MAG: hypothetical protein KZQ92_23230 [Candidatus Thiodiazotropha sp. (ex Lucinoma borealis)]|nr:hypothetical protein [Candidatus Thiodiazotropha sp. (ex Lucinoma borealis)]MCU7866875.1 hypothetical protein [Candidatus Thiodiazotropha sp. (ex Lucinoma borealis)]MCU7870100.1 hypothetical protein [Candidatus Thiodiazotropha sp. (ex Lucinoma borealis)]MCU7873573.1 hypothetical protein [Candidatus Thiodiazotropha sp. (ex Lucinoma borealis)]
MKKTTNGLLCIDTRSCIEVMLLGVLEAADAYIPYIGSNIDEWSEFQKCYKKHSNNNFLRCVNELVWEHGLHRDSLICLISGSHRRGVMAANILYVAGYSNVVVELGTRRGNAVESGMAGDGRVINCWRNGKLAWTNSLSQADGSRLH